MTDEDKKALKNALINNLVTWWERQPWARIERFEEELLIIDGSAYSLDELAEYIVSQLSSRVEMK